MSEREGASERERAREREREREQERGRGREGERGSRSAPIAYFFRSTLTALCARARAHTSRKNHHPGRVEAGEKVGADEVLETNVVYTAWRICVGLKCGVEYTFIYREYSYTYAQVPHEQSNIHVHI